MKKRLITSAFIVLALGLALVSRLWTLFVFDLFILGLGVMGAVEIARALERQGKYTNFVIVGTMPAVLYLLFILVIRFDLTWQYLLVMLLGSIIAYFVLIFLVTLLSKKTSHQEMAKYGLENVKLSRYALDKAMYSLSVLVYPTLLFMALIFINHFYELSFINSVSASSNFKMLTWFALLSVFVVSMVTDSMAYVVGSSLKGPKLCPLISPNKTISGAIGGLVFGISANMLLYFIFTSSFAFNFEMGFVNVSWWGIMLITLFGSAITQIGDIVASALKRKSRIKDYGTIFPGHGGVMDRVDGLVCNAMFTFLVYFIIFIVV